MNRPGPGGVAIAACLTAAGAADVYVGVKHKDYMTDACRRHQYFTAAFLLVFFLHVLDRLGRLDPFRAIAKCAERWTT